MCRTTKASARLKANSGTPRALVAPGCAYSTPGVRRDEHTMVAPALPTSGMVHSLAMTRHYTRERSVPTFCRICEAACGWLADLDASGQPVRLRPYREHPVSQGFVCAKGTRFLEVAEHPDRLL